MPAMPQSNIHLDILMGRDETLEVFEAFGGTHDGFMLPELILIDVYRADGSAIYEHPRGYGEEASHVNSLFVHYHTHVKLLPHLSTQQRFHKCTIALGLMRTRLRSKIHT